MVLHSSFLYPGILFITVWWLSENNVIIDQVVIALFFQHWSTYGEMRFLLNWNCNLFCASKQLKWCPWKWQNLCLLYTIYEELVSKTSYIYFYMLLSCSSGHSKEANFQNKIYFKWKMSILIEIWNSRYQQIQNSTIVRTACWPCH